jgi:hypothetical protein
LFLARRPDDAALGAVLTCALATLLTFGLLALCDTPVLRGIGLTVSLGVVAAFLLACAAAEGEAGMSFPLAITARSVVTALGAGTPALRAALHARRGGLAPCAFPGAPADIWAGQVAGLDAAAPPRDLAPYDCRNNRLAELALRSDGFEAAVAAAVARHGAARVALVVGTSTAGIEETEQAYAARENGALPAPSTTSARMTSRRCRTTCAPGSAWAARRWWSAPPAPPARARSWRAPG